MGARGDCVPRHGVVARAWLAGCLRATSGNTADTAWQYCPGSRSDTPPRQALVRLGSERRRVALPMCRYVRHAALRAHSRARTSAADLGVAPRKARPFLASDADPLPRATPAPRYHRRARLSHAQEPGARYHPIRRARAGARSASRGNTARQYRQYCQRLRGGHRPALDSRTDLDTRDEPNRRGPTERSTSESSHARRQSRRPTA